MTPKHYTAAVRAYAREVGGQTTSSKRPGGRKQEPRLSLVIAIEAEKDLTENMMLGKFAVFDRGKLVDNGFICPDNFHDALLKRLSIFCEDETRAVRWIGNQPRVLRRKQFLREVFFPIVYRRKGRLIGFDLPYVISRLAVRWPVARVAPYTGGFSFVMLQYVDEQGELVDDRLFPRIGVKSIDSKRARIGFTSAWIKKPDASNGKKSKSKRTHRGRFLDSRVLAYALTDQDLSLSAACEAYGVDMSQTPSAAHDGSIERTAEELLARTEHIWQLSQKLLEEFGNHPIALTPEYAFSPASMGKAYLREMGVTIPKIDPDHKVGMSENEILGAAMVSYFGGRSEIRARKVAVPVLYCDFLSMYPTVNVLMGLWRLLTSEKVRVKDATEDVKKFVLKADQESLFRQETWSELPALVLVVPEGDILPTRTRYGHSTRSSYTIGLNHLTTPIPMWLTLPDVVASKILTGKAPKIVRAIRFVPIGKQSGLKQVKLGGTIDIDPTQDDFFKKIVEERMRVKSATDISAAEAERLSQFLKTLDNSVAYGILAELNRQDGEEADVEVFGLETFRCDVEKPEKPGDFFFPIIATLIAGAARLMLTLVEAEVRKLGGSFAFMDTDSIAIVSSKSGGLIACPGGAELTADGREALKALTWQEVGNLRDKFKKLNPYDRGAVPGSILKMEDENFSEKSGQRELTQLLCYAIASKKYVLVNIYGDAVVLRKFSEHGLGNYLPPIDPASGEAVVDWARDAWRTILNPVFPRSERKALTWKGQIIKTMMRMSTPSMMGWFESFNKTNGNYRQSVKPFNSFEHAPLDPILRHSKQGKKGICLVSPVGLPSSRDRAWINIHDPDGPHIQVVQRDRNGSGSNVYVGLPFADLIMSHAHAPEPKSLGPDWRPCGRKTIGVLRRRPIPVLDVVHIGKESNDFELVQARLVGSEQEVLTTYEKDPWLYVQPVLVQMPAKMLIDRTRYKRRMVNYLKTGERRPSEEHFPNVLTAVADYSREKLREMDRQKIPKDDLPAVKLFAAHLANSG